jgi:hypothetical protein
MCLKQTQARSKPERWRFKFRPWIEKLLATGTKSLASEEASYKKLGELIDVAAGQKPGKRNPRPRREGLSERVLRRDARDR